MTTSSAHPSIKSYRAGQDRNDAKARSHTYAETEDGLYPMCGYGWNRGNGESFSIFREQLGSEGECKVCRKRLEQGLPPVKYGFKHKTRWL